MLGAGRPIRKQMPSPGQTGSVSLSGQKSRFQSDLPKQAPITSWERERG